MSLLLKNPLKSRCKFHNLTSIVLLGLLMLLHYNLRRYSQSSYLVTLHNLEKTFASTQDDKHEFPVNISPYDLGTTLVIRGGSCT